MRMPSEQKGTQFQQPPPNRARRPVNPYAGRTCPVQQVYLPLGTIHVRIYLDAEGEFMRSLHVHKANTVEVLCAHPFVCQVCESLKEIPDEWEKKWKYSPREISFCYAWIDRYDRKRRHVLLKQPILLWGPRRFGDKLCEIIAGFRTGEELSRFFRPEEFFPLLKIEADERGLNIDMALGPRLRAVAPPLPKSLPPLSRCIYPVNEPPNQERQARYIKNMKRAYEKAAAAGMPTMRINSRDE